MLYFDIMLSGNHINDSWGLWSNYNMESLALKNILMVAIFFLFVSSHFSLAFENVDCHVVEEKVDKFDFSTGIRLMEESIETAHAKIETVYDKSGNFSKQKAIINSKTSPLYDGVMGLTLSADGKHYAYTALKDGKIFPVIDGKRQKFELTVDTDCCGEGGHWFEVWQYTNYIFSPDGKRVTFLEIGENGYRLILDDKVVDESSMLGGFQFSPDGKFLAYFTKEPDIFPKEVFLVVNGRKIWKYDVHRFNSIGRENVEILFFNNGSITSLGYNGGKLVRVSCKLKNIAEW